MSVASAPVVRPQPQAPRPEIVRPRPQKPSNNGLWIGLIIAVVMLSAAGLLWRRRTAPVPSAPFVTGGTTGAVRTATAVPGTVEKTIRVTGATAAENFVSLITPRLSGSRSDRLRDTSATAPSSNSSATPASTSSNASSATSASGGSSNANPAFQSATNRFGGTLRGSSTGPQASASANTPAASSTMGSSGVGSAADSLGGGGGPGGGNGPGDFMLVLQHAVPPGSHVHKGDVIAEFDRQYMLLRLDDYTASVVQSEASLKKQKAEIEITQHAHEQLIDSAKADLDKARLDLKTVPVLSAIDAERAKLALDQAEARYKQLLNEVKFVKISQESDIRNAALDLAQSKIELKRAQANTDKMIVKAPIDGVAVMQTTFRGAELGQIQEGDQLWPGMFFMQVVNPASMVVGAMLNQVDCEKVRVGSKARIHFDAYPGLTLPGHVVSIGAVTKPAGSRPNYVKEVPVRLKVDAMDKRVIPDLSVSAEIVVDAPQRAEATVPLGAVFTDENLGKKFVLVERPSGWQRREVELGAANNVVAVVKRGLRSGEKVALDVPFPTEPRLPTEPRPSGSGSPGSGPQGN
ncbi:MAG: HlyD family secretion protein [Bryobacteraceae bacterium]